MGNLRLVRPSGQGQPDASRRRVRLPELDLNDKAEVNAWTMALEDAIDDMAAAADEATLSKLARVLSRAEARRRIFVAWDVTHQLLGAAPGCAMRPAKSTGDSFLVLDLETGIDASLPALPKRDDDKDVFPPIPYHQILVMGAALLDALYRVRRIWVVGEGKSELDMLLALTSFLNEQYAMKKAITVVGFNSRGFDMPVLMARCLRHGIAAPWYYAQRDVRFRFSASGHFDLMDFLTDHGAARAYGLDLAARLAGSCGKLGVHGRDVAEMIAAGKLEEVRAYCLDRKSVV
jgi:3'-5' exonuclease